MAQKTQRWILKQAGAQPPIFKMNKKYFLTLSLLGFVVLSFLFGMWFYSNPQVRKEKIDEYKEKIMKKERRFWNSPRN